MVPGPERTLMVFAYSELTQKRSISKVGFVGDAVKVGFSVDVRVMEGVNAAVAVALAVELALGATVGVSGSGVKVTAGAVGERIRDVGVGVPEAGGVEIKVDRKASRIRTPMPIGMAY